MNGHGTAQHDDAPVITDLEAFAYTVPTDEPEADGTLAWDATTLVLVTARASDHSVGYGWTYSAPESAGLVRGLRLISACRPCVRQIRSGSAPMME